MTATSATTAREVITSEIAGLYRTLRHRAIRYAPAGCRSEYESRLDLAVAALADMLEEQGEDGLAREVRRTRGARICQETQEGARCVVVGRQGADTAATGNGHSVAIWTTKVYVARRRKGDGLLTWRLESMLSGHSTAGRAVSGPMEARARGHAEDIGAPYVHHCTHGEICD